MIFGRYRGQGSGTVVFEGERNGRRERYGPGHLPRDRPRERDIPRLWAARRIGDLNRQLRLEGQSDVLIREIRELGLRYGILTGYTSCLVQEPTLAMNQPGTPGTRQPRRDVMPMATPAPAAQTGAASSRPPRPTDSSPAPPASPMPKWRRMPASIR